MAEWTEGHGRKPCPDGGGVLVHRRLLPQYESDGNGPKRGRIQALEFREQMRFFNVEAARATPLIPHPDACDLHCKSNVGAG